MQGQAQGPEMLRPVVLLPVPAEESIDPQMVQNHRAICLLGVPLYDLYINLYVGLLLGHRADILYHQSKCSVRLGD